MADPLTLLRDFNIAKRLDEVKVEGDTVRFGNQYEFHKKAPTGYRMNTGMLCPLDVIHFALTHRDKVVTEYMKLARDAGLEWLPTVERGKVLRFLDGLETLQLETPAAVPIQEPAAKRQRTDGSAADARYTRQLRDRNSMLLAHGDKKFSLVLEIANREHVKLGAMLKQQAAADAHRHKQQQSQAAPDVTAAKPAAAKPASRYATERSQDEMATAAFGAAGAGALKVFGNMYAPAVGGGGNQPDTQPANGAAAPSQPAGSQRAKEPSASQQHRSSSHKHASSSQSSSRHGPPAGSSRHAAPPSSTPSDPLQGQIPIILVPSGMTAMINMYNARSFLEEGRYEPSAQAAANGAQKVQQIQITHTSGKTPGKSVVYMVTDKVPDKKDTLMWGRVVAVIVQGAKWQFKDFPFKGADKGDMAETFQKVAGYFIHFSDDKVPDTVANWNVKRLGLAREKRHMDSPVVLDLWRHLTEYLQARKSPLAY